jgi:uncharacterized RDD family membrane protein YckC/DNA-binding transcriptional ArsR family regulator
MRYMGDTGAEHAIFKVLSHPIRSKIIESVYENGELSYTDILSILKIDTGQLNFHLRNMAELYEHDASGNYRLTDKGKFAYYMLMEVKKRLGETASPLEPQASFSKRTLATLIDYALFLGSPLGLMALLSLWFPFTPDPMLITLFFHLLFFFTFVAFMSMETYNGQTVGKFITKIKVIKEDGRKLDMNEGIFRNIAKVYLLPLDVILGVLLYKHEGYIRFSDKFLKLRVVDVSVSMITIPHDSNSKDIKQIAARR